MKRFLILLLALMPSLAYAQNYKPLEKVVLPKGEEVQVVKPRTLGSEQDYYMAAHDNGRKVMTADFSVPAECRIIFDYNDAIDRDCDIARLQVGGVNYYLKVVFVFMGHVIYIQQDHVKHIAVSGLQSITYMKNGEETYTDNYSLTQQELWRRTAEELGKAAYIIY